LIEQSTRPQPCPACVDGQRGKPDNTCLTAGVPMDNEQDLTEEQRIMRMMRKTLSYVVRDTAPRDGLASPLSEATIMNIKDCLVVISNREAELANVQMANRNEKPHYSDETPNAHVVKISSIPKKTH
jgi:hypothetical protein